MSRAASPFRRSSGALALRAVLSMACALGAACGKAPVNPFVTTSSTGGAGGLGQGGTGGGNTVDPELGGPCVDDSQCDDGISCTFDACDHTVQRCRFKHDDSLCQDTVYCNGIERCDQKLGCVAGDPIDCGDKDACTIDACVETAKSCSHAPRDVDGDGDPDAHCGGKDCDDLNPNVSSLAPELCGNHVDDNCDGMVDEATCITPQHDTCLDALQISAPGSYALDTTGAMFDYPTSCEPAGSSLHDVVAAILLPPGPPVDVIVDATAYQDVALALAGQCGDPATELACSPAFVSTSGKVARIRARSLGNDTIATAYPLYVASGGVGGPVTLSVDFVPAAPAPTNETCGTAMPITPGSPVVVDLAGTAMDVASACAHPGGDLVYSFSLAAPADVDVYGTSPDGIAVPTVSLRDASCALPADEIACASNASAHVFRHSLPAGDYYVAIGGSAPAQVSLDVEVSAPTAPPADETCVGAPMLAPNVTQNVLFAFHEDDINTGCFGAAVDAAYDLSLNAPSDVLLVQRIAGSDTGSVQLAKPGCAPADLVGCAFSTRSPDLLSKRNVAAGDYRVVVESISGKDQQLTAFVRPTAPAILVPFADDCADPVTIPSTGGFFQGNTANATANFSAGCDNAGGPPNGAPDQLLKLVLTEEKRVVFDMGGSGYATLLDVREGPDCPGTEVPVGCSANIGGPSGQRSYLDLDLHAGTYFVQVDGVGVDAGQWFLNVFVADPSP